MINTSISRRLILIGDIALTYSLPWLTWHQSSFIRQEVKRVLELSSPMPTLPNPTSLIHQVDLSVRTDCISHQFQHPRVLLLQHLRILLFYSRHPRHNHLLTPLKSSLLLFLNAVQLRPEQELVPWWNYHRDLLTLTPEKGGCGSRLVYNQLTFMYYVYSRTMSVIVVLFMQQTCCKILCSVCVCVSCCCCLFNTLILC